MSGQAVWTWPHVDRLGGTAAAKGATGTVDLADEDFGLGPFLRPEGC
jgi:hypothetical protein